MHNSRASPFHNKRLVLGLFLLLHLSCVPVDGSVEPPRAGHSAWTAVSQQCHMTPVPRTAWQPQGGAASSFLHCVLYLRAVPGGTRGTCSGEQQGTIRTADRGEILTSFKMLPNVYGVSASISWESIAWKYTYCFPEFYTQVFVVVPISRLLFTVLSNNLKLS